MCQSVGIVTSPGTSVANVTDRRDLATLAAANPKGEKMGGRPTGVGMAMVNSEPQGIKRERKLRRQDVTVVDMRPDSRPSENSPELTLHLLRLITLPEALGFSEIGTCKIKGWLYSETLRSAETEILADSGAAFSCIAKSFVDSLPEKIRIGPPPANRNAVDASNRPVNIIGQVVLSMRLQTINGILEIQKMIFTVLQVLSVPVIIGCEVLGFLDFEVRTKYAVLKGQKIPRVLSDKPEWKKTCLCD